MEDGINSACAVVLVFVFIFVFAFVFVVELEDTGCGLSSRRRIWNTFYCMSVGIMTAVDRGSEHNS